jgi:hypothetical protein
VALRGRRSDFQVNHRLPRGDAIAQCPLPSYHSSVVKVADHTALERAGCLCIRPFLIPGALREREGSPHLVGQALRPCDAAIRLDAPSLAPYNGACERPRARCGSCEASPHPA